MVFWLLVRTFGVVIFVFIFLGGTVHVTVVVKNFSSEPILSQNPYFRIGVLIRSLNQERSHGLGRRAFCSVWALERSAVVAVVVMVVPTSATAYMYPTTVL